MTTPATPAADAAQHREIVSRLQDEADQARNDGANDIAQLLDDAVAHIQQRALEFLSAEAQADERESALVADRDALRAAAAVTDRLLPILSNCLKHQQVNSASEIMRQIEQELAALAAPAVEGE